MTEVATEENQVVLNNEMEEGDEEVAKKETFQWNTPADEFAEDVASDVEEESEDENAGAENNRSAGNNQVVEAFVNYFYEGAVPQMVLGANLSSFLALSELYNLLPLKSQAEDLAIKNLNIENVVEIFSLAKIYNAEILLEATKVFILENKKILGQQDLSQIPKGVMEELFILLSQS